MNGKTIATALMLVVGGCTALPPEEDVASTTESICCGPCCDINDDCLEPGDRGPGPCDVCDPGRNRSDWSIDPACLDAGAPDDDAGAPGDDDDDMAGDDDDDMAGDDDDDDMVGDDDDDMAGDDDDDMAGDDDDDTVDAGTDRGDGGDGCRVDDSGAPLGALGMLMIGLVVSSRRRRRG